MTVEEIKSKFPKETENLSDEQIAVYAQASEVLSELFISFIKRNFNKENQAKSA